MPFAIPPFAKVLVLFFVQGLMLWVLTYFPNEEDVAVIWLAGMATLVAWWSMWLALHPERTWQPWLECLAVAGATYWVPVFCDGLLRSTRGGEPWFPPMHVVAYLVLSIQVVLTFPLALLLCGVRWATGWRLQTSITAWQVGLRGLFLLMLGLALHLAAFQPLLQELIQLKTGPVWDALYFWSTSLLLISWVAIIALGAAMLVLGPRVHKRSVLVMALGSLGLFVTATIFRKDWPGVLQFFAPGLATIYVTALGNALALRAIGYRLARRPHQPAESQASEPLVP